MHDFCEFKYTSIFLENFLENENDYEILSRSISIMQLLIHQQIFYYLEKLICSIMKLKFKLNEVYGTHRLFYLFCEIIEG